MDEHSQGPNPKLRPRLPSAAEFLELCEWLAPRTYAETPEEVAGTAAIAVFDRYITDCPGYAGKVMSVVWSGSPSMYDVFTWNDEGLVQQPREGT